MPTLRFGICGLGFMGRTHFGNIQDHADAEVVALCDRDEHLLAGNWNSDTGNIGARDGERVDVSHLACYRDSAELLRDPDVDVVVIALPTPLHADLTVAALEAGKHVLCEKPMGPTVADCDAMCAAARRTGRTLMVGQCIRFWPQYETIKAAVDAGQIGAVQFASLKRLASPPTFGAANWFMDHHQSGGALMDLHVHDVDFAHHLLGRPSRIQACGGCGPSGGIDHVVATHHFDDGHYAVLEGGWSFHRPFPFEMAITVQGATGTLSWCLSDGPDVKLYAGGDDPEILPSAAGDGWSREIAYFIGCVSRGQPVAQCTPESSRLSIALAEAERRGVMTGESVATASI